MSGCRWPELHSVGRIHLAKWLTNRHHRATSTPVPRCVQAAADYDTTSADASADQTSVRCRIQESTDQTTCQLSRTTTGRCAATTNANRRKYQSSIPQDMGLLAKLVSTCLYRTFAELVHVRRCHHRRLPDALSPFRRNRPLLSPSRLKRRLPNLRIHSLRHRLNRRLPNLRILALRFSTRFR